MRGVGKPVARDRRREVSEPGGGQLRGAQQLVPAQEVGRARNVWPRAQLADGCRGGPPAGERGRERVEDARAVDRKARRARITQDHPVAGVQRQRVMEPEAGVDRGRRTAVVRRFADGRRAERPHPGPGAGGADVQQQVGRKLRVRVVRRGNDPDVELAGERPAARLDESHAALGEIGGDTAQVERDPRDAGDGLGGLAQGLEAAHPDGPARGGEQQFLAVAHRAGGQRARDDRAGAADRERAVDPEPDRGAGLGTFRAWLAAQARHQANKRVLEVVEALARDRADGDGLHRAQADPGDLSQGLTSCQARVGQVRAGDDQEAVPDPEGVHGGEVLGGLRHPAPVGRHDEHDRRDRAQTGQHVGDEALVAGDVDERELLRWPSWHHGRERHPGVAEVDGHAPAAFLRPAVRFHPGEGADERGLAVVHVPGGRDNVHQPTVFFADKRSTGPVS